MKNYSYLMLVLLAAFSVASVNAMDKKRVVSAANAGATALRGAVQKGKHMSQLQNPDTPQDGVSDAFRNAMRNLQATSRQEAADAHLHQLNNRTAHQAGVTEGFFQALQRVEGEVWQAAAAAHLKQLTSTDNVDGVSNGFRTALTGVRQAGAQLHLDQLTSPQEGVSDDFRTALTGVRQTSATAARAEAARRAHRGYILSALGGLAVGGTAAVLALRGGHGTPSDSGSLLGWFKS